MRLLKYLITCGFAAAFLLPVWGQAKFSTVIQERELGKNDYLQVEYMVENASSVGAITPPAFPGFTVVSGPMQQSGMSIINGAVSRYEGVTYVLKPSATGKFSIGGAAAVIDGKPMHSNSVMVTVTNAAPRGSASPSNPLFGLGLPEDMPEVDEEYFLKKDESAAEKIKNNLLVKLDVSKTSCYAGEPIIATYKLYSRLKSESRITKRPSLSQFSVYDMVQPEANHPTIEKVNGKLYNAHIIRKVQLYPLQDGSFVLDPVEIDNTVRFLRLQNEGGRMNMQQMLDDYMNGISDGKIEEEQVALASKPVTITVKPLPAAGRPEWFDGAVGKFSLSALLPKTSIAAGETAVLQVTLKGQGNLTLINAPQVKWPQGVEAFEPSVKDNLDKTVAPINGTKLFEYSFTAKTPGRIIIPPVQLAYFDPSVNAYKTIHTDSLIAEISSAAGMAKHTIMQKNNPATGDFSRAKWLWVLLPALLILLLVLLLKNKGKAKAKKTAAPPEPVIPPPVHYFEGARHALTAVNSQLFYRETGKAVWQLLADRLQLVSSQLNKPTVIRLLQQHPSGYEAIPLLEEVLHHCELALYTPVHTESDMRITLQKAERLEELLTVARQIPPGANP